MLCARSHKEGASFDYFCTNWIDCVLVENVMEQFCRYHRNLVSEPNFSKWKSDMLNTIEDHYYHYFTTTKYVGMKLLTSLILTSIYDIKTLHNNTLFSMFVAFPQIIRMTLVMRGPCLKRCTLIRTRTAYPCLRCGWNVNLWRKQMMRPEDSLTRRPCMKGTMSSGDRPHKLWQEATTQII